MKTKYPVILVHGMLVKELWFFKSFGYIGKELRKKDFKIFISHHDAIGSIESNALQIKEEITSILLAEGAEKVNIIAHSKGGLDSRYMISKLNMSDKIASLTTLSTPHHGSHLASKVLKMPKWCARPLAFYWDFIYRILGDRKPNLMKLGEQLKVESLLEFNEQVLDSPVVYYQSYGSKLSKKKEDIVMSVPHLFTKSIEGEETDGVVSLSSSQWGEYKGEVLDESLSHSEMIGIFTRRKKKQKVLSFYLNLLKDLQESGF